MHLGVPLQTIRHRLVVPRVETNTCVWFLCSHPRTESTNHKKVINDHVKHTSPLQDHCCVLGVFFPKKPITSTKTTFEGTHYSCAKDSCTQSVKIGFMLNGTWKRGEGEKWLKSKHRYWIHAASSTETCYAASRWHREKRYTLCTVTPPVHFPPCITCFCWKQKSGGTQ